MKNILYIVFLFLGLSASAQNGGACVYMLPDSTVICYTTGNSGNPSISACQSDAAAAGALPMDCLDSPFASCASWYVTSGISCFYGGTGNCASGNACDVLTLPIELISWTGLYKDGANLLTWKTATEINNDYFYIERSQDGYKWDIIGTPNAAGTSSQELSYNFNDMEFRSTVNYYRLSQVDFDGRSETFDIIVIDNTIHEKALSRRYTTIGIELTDDALQYYIGIYIEIYKDGTSERLFRNGN